MARDLFEQFPLILVKLNEFLKMFNLKFWKIQLEFLEKVTSEHGLIILGTLLLNPYSVFVFFLIQNVNEDRFTPVVISIQKEVCRASMLEVIRYSTLVYRKYKLLPTVLIIFSKYYSSLDDCEVNINIDSPFTRIESKFWAQDCLLFLPDSVNTPVNSKPTRSFLFAQC
ncbi:hypothetical protein BDF21DRAFT_394738 [Thamnidium elegans]|nr:hypothetical protein BDF21DRAFT_394738 [Thamnidium elegans]